MRIRILLALVAVCISGCSDESRQKAGEAANKAQQAATQAVADVRDAATQAAGSVEEQRTASLVVSRARELARVVDAKDLERLKRFCIEQDTGAYREVMGCYYHAFVVEDQQGPAAARKYLADEIARDDLSAGRAKALGGLDKYFKAKGSLRTRDAALLVLVVALECKFPRYGGKAGMLIAKELGLMEPPAAATQPAG